MEIFYVDKKGIHLDRVEIFYIYKEIAKGIQLNDNHTITSNKIIGNITIPKQIRGIHSYQVTYFQFSK
jgi:hypothetical protein